MSAFLLALLLITQDRSAQDRPAEKCALSGTVTDSATALGLSKVQIFAEPLGDSEGPIAVSNTDSKGNFSMVELDPGGYRIKAIRNGYLDTYYGARRGDSKGTTVTLEAGQEIKDLQVKLLPYAVIAGTIRDSDGEPVADATVAIRRVIYRGGQRDLEDSEQIATDDLGQYRAANLTSGRYYVVAQPKELFNSFHPPIDHSSKGSQPVEVLLTAYYPGVPDRAAAKTIEVIAGAHVSGIDITLSRGRIHTVSGHVALPKGVTASVIVSLPESPFGDRIAWAYNVKDDFEIRGVPPGSYTLRAWAETPVRLSGGASGPERDYTAETPLTVDSADVTGIKLSLNPNPIVAGHVTVDGEKPIPLHNGAVVFGSGDSGAEIDGENNFASSMHPGHYVIRVAGDQMENDLVIKSIRMEQADLLRDELTLAPGTSVQLQIVLAPDGGRIEGRVLDKDEKTVAGATVIAVPEASLRLRPDRFYQASTDQHGHYEMKNVAPGDYKLFAWDDVEPGAWFDPDFLRDIEPHAEAIKIETRGHASVAVHLPGVK